MSRFVDVSGVTLIFLLNNNHKVNVHDVMFLLHQFCSYDQWYNNKTYYIPVQKIKRQNITYIQNSSSVSIIWRYLCISLLKNQTKTKLRCTQCSTSDVDTIHKVVCVLVREMNEYYNINMYYIGIHSMCIMNEGRCHISKKENSSVQVFLFKCTLFIFCKIRSYIFFMEMLSVNYNEERKKMVFMLNINEQSSDRHNFRRKKGNLKLGEM